MKVQYLIVTRDLKLAINRIKKRYKIKKEKLKLYAQRVWHLVDCFNYFNITFVPQEKNQKENSLAVATSPYNPSDSQTYDTFHVKTIFRPFVPNNGDC
jgi:hypothetical protein